MRSGQVRSLRGVGEDVNPAIIMEVTREQLYLMSLVENIARRPPSNKALLFEVRSLTERGYKADDISKNSDWRKATLTELCSFSKGRGGSLQAVDDGRIPLRIAIIISTEPTSRSRKLSLRRMKRVTFEEQVGDRRRIIAMRLARDRGSEQSNPTKKDFGWGTDRRV